MSDLGTRSNTLIADFTRSRPTYDLFTNKIESLIGELLRENDLRPHSIEARTKTIESFTEKVGRSSKDYENSSKEVTDLSAVRVILHDLHELERSKAVLEACFQIDWGNSSDKGDEFEPNEFGYNSIHYVASLTDDRSGLPEWKNYSNLKFEIQVRTVLQHAWASISHRLQYKRENDVPKNLRRQLFRLAALVELADDEFSNLLDRTAKTDESIRKSVTANNLDIDLNLLSLRLFLENYESLANISNTAESFGFNVVPESDDESSSIHEILFICRMVEIDSIAQLKDCLDKSLNWTESLFEQLIESHNGWTVTPEFLIVLILIASKPERISIASIIKNGWSEALANDVVSLSINLSK